MPFHFCSQCGSKLQPDFKFCPSCGEKLPCPADECGPGNSPAVSQKEAATASLVRPSLASVRGCEPPEHTQCITATSSPTRPGLRRSRNSLRLEKDVTFNNKDPIPEVRGKVKFSSPVKKLEEGNGLFDKTSDTAERSRVDVCPVAALSPISSPVSKSPGKGKGKAKKAKHSSAVEPLQEGEEVTDTTGRKWKLIKLLSQSLTELIYEVQKTTLKSNSKESNHILKLGAKDGRIFNEQNFLQRAAKPASVEKWIKQSKVPFLGIPACVGFGLHADSYRFLIFPDMGQTLHSIIEEEDDLLSEKDVLHLAYRILDVLQYMHSNEYVHADINGENIYIQQGQRSLVYLVGYCHAFRYCPGGRHVEYREASRTPHEGNVEFISLDAHKGAAPSRRSDLQSLGYCMLRWHTGPLPWTTVIQPDQVAKQKQRFMEDVPALLSHCFGKKKVSSAFETYLTAVMALQYSEQPDYSALKGGLSAALLQMGGSLEQPLSFR
ncbi:inactive serine/threonine-protein kinase VRK3 isoform X2 [Betta splendens]|uniref:Inactive serine/threonine-protein kinase VRK3 isoform X2 n=1 Tax=Betta splendens TaxID=158456 RepID=A0A6P7M2H6_BETSP|nr:inactive serine/threonine-protein kinase VRK3 isoform X2 [Betta splendens]